MSALRHQMILASAGSGKTYALTSRFVRLLAGGAAPERIVALTFTRKAAGEFFDEILKKLACAAAEPAYAQKLAAEIGAPAFGAAEFLRLLRGMIEAMPRLQLGTLDGFFARVVRAFPLELGLGGDFEIMEATAARRERRRVLRRMFAAAGEPDAAQREFIEAFKRATFGVDEKQIARVLDGFLDEHSEKFLAAPDAAQWGDPARIWPEGCAWLAAAAQREESVRALHVALTWATLGDKQRARLEDFFAALPEWSPGATLPKPVEYLVKNAFAAWPTLAEIVVERKKVSLPPAARAALGAVVAGLAGAEIARRLEMTRGLFAVLRGYEQNYHASVRRAGRLTFADVLRLLLPGAGAPVLSAEISGDARLLIDWRLDAQFDHWLLDEFQDTSFAQWSVLRNLIDEAVQDAEGRRSFFYVGDVKQAIFAWRGGDPRLFREIFDHYNCAAPGAIVEERLDVSWRSGPAVIAMVNRVFGDDGALRGVAPADTAAAWTREWRPHTSAQPKLTGCAELRHADDESGRFAATLRVLREIEPQRRGLDVAVLVQKNDTAAALADFLRREGGLAAVAESDRLIATDNPLTTALLAFLRAAVHPGDTLAWEHVSMTPLAAKLGLASPEAATERVLAAVHEHGFAGALAAWLGRLAPVLAGDAFSRDRGAQLIAAAAEFDEGGSRDVAEFIEFAENWSVRDTDAAGVVRVMTIHKSKGLGFDVVILPDLEGDSIATRRGGLAVQHAPDRSVAWILDPPAKIFSEHDPVLAARAAADAADRAAENLCLLYVAMTRAKRGLYVITKPPGESTSKNFPRLLEETLGETWQEGDVRWFESIAPVAPVTPAGHATWNLAEPSRPARAARRPSRTPSELKKGSVGGGLLFSLESGLAVAADFGHAVHALLAEVEWAGAADATRWAAAWVARGIDRAAIDEAVGCLRAPGLDGVWRETAQAEVWREQAFEIVLDGAWVTGVFDRVVVEREASGRAVRATVFDFKTDRVVGEAAVMAAVARHAGQINVYRRVVARLAGLAEGAVAGEVIFTRPGRRAAVPATGAKF